MNKQKCYSCILKCLNMTQMSVVCEILEQGDREIWSYQKMVAETIIKLKQQIIFEKKNKANFLIQRRHSVVLSISYFLAVTLNDTHFPTLAIVLEICWFLEVFLFEALSFVLYWKVIFWLKANKKLYYKKIL